MMTDIKHKYRVKDLSYHDKDTYNQVICQIEEIFNKYGHKLQKARELAQKLKDGIEKISPFIQQSTDKVCPDCKDVCCINKHGYYNREDLIYIHALGLRPPAYEFKRKDSDPCQFLSERGCIMERAVRPSSCNWYFCDSMFEHMEKRPDYQEFDNCLRDVADLWMNLMEEFVRVVETRFSFKEITDALDDGRM